MRKGWLKTLLLTGSILSLMFLVLLLVHFTPQPPVSEMEYAREALSKARERRADTYSKKLFNEARIYYDSAMVNWQRENNRFIYLRNYDNVLRFAELSAEKANQASENSVSSSLSLKKKLKVKIDSLNKLVNEITEFFNAYPLSFEIRSRISNGKLLLKEGEIEFAKGQYLQANRKINDSEYLLISSHVNASENLKTYFKSFSAWEKWVKSTINDSKKNRDYSIIIDKFSRKCIVYYCGVKKYEFEAELGKNWVGHKRVKGDKATPEGMYKVVKKIEGSKTKYYKALLIDYPNQEDKENFKLELSRGTIPSYAKIGDSIEIHGNGGKGADWTEGCVALTDTEMDVIYRIIRVGTPVTIVGSTEDLNSILNR